MDGLNGLFDTIAILLAAAFFAGFFALEIGFSIYCARDDRDARPV